MTAPLDAMPAHYADPDLVALYDLDGRKADEASFYPVVVGATPLRVLEAGCGTGWLAHELARHGHRVTGLDPAANMLAVARAKAGADAIAWIEADMRAFELPERFDVIVLTGHAFQVLFTDDDIALALACFAKHLAPGGRLMFETRNPLAKEWLSWTRERTSTMLQHPSLGPVEVCWLGRLSRDPELVVVDGHFHFLRSGVHKVSNSLLRFAPQATLQRLLQDAGLGAQTWHGGWDKCPVRPTSPELIVVAQRSRG